MFSHPVRTEVRGTVRFFFVVAFPPPPVTDPATRLSIFRRERRSTYRLISSDRRRPFLSERLGLALRLGLSKPFGFSSERIERRLSAPSVRGRRVTTFAPPLGAGRGPVGNLDCDVIIHRYFGESSRMYFKFRPYSMGLLLHSSGKLGGKICGFVVDELWEIRGATIPIESAHPTRKYGRYVDSVENLRCENWKKKF